MSITIYDTLQRKKVPFVPLEEGRVKMYVCGPTVYDHIHIGNARPVIFFDTVRRYLEYKGYQVTYIQNFTDVDDKIINAARQEGRSPLEVAETYIKAYLDLAKQLNIKPATAHPRVTENMEEIVGFIDRLISLGLAYEAAGDVYYRTGKFDGYGKLSQQKKEELLAGARVEVNEEKESPLDFALWKKAKPGEISWPSPWGPGRPGWHIECSAMIKKHLGESIDIHGGGADLTFPHHENEIAQSEGLTGKPLARYWMHNAMLTVNEEKMSKSLGNFIQVKELLKQHDPQVFRYFMLTGHYRTPINYSDELLVQAAHSLERLKTTVANLDHALNHSGKAPQAEGHESRSELAVKYRARFEAAMDDDFNTANAISHLFELSREANALLNQREVDPAQLTAMRATLVELADVLGLRLAAEPALLDEEIERLIEERNEARRARDFEKADRIRDQLAERGIILEDTPQGVRWRRK